MTNDVNFENLPVEIAALKEEIEPLREERDYYKIEFEKCVDILRAIRQVLSDSPQKPPKSKTKVKAKPRGGRRGGAIRVYDDSNDQSQLKRFQKNWYQYNFLQRKADRPQLTKEAYLEKLRRDGIALASFTPEFKD